MLVARLTKQVYLHYNRKPDPEFLLKAERHSPSKSLLL